MPNPTQPNPNPMPAKSDVLQAGPHAQLSSEVVAKAVARHKREHPAAKITAQKTKKRR